MKDRLAGLLVVIVAAGLGDPLGAQNAPGWQRELVRDILAAKRCEVDFLSHVIERRVDGQNFIMAKVHCQDQRAFDVTRRSDNASFEYRECEKRDETSC